MKSKLIAVLCLLGLGVFSQLNLSAAKNETSGINVISLNTSTTSRLAEIVQEGIDSGAYPGAVLMVGRGDKILYEKAFGGLTYDADTTPTAMNTIYDLASVSKVVGTATAAMKLIEEGRMKLTDTVASHFPPYADQGKERVTIKDLMTHVSGMKSYDAAKNAEAIRQPGQSSADALLNRFAQIPLSNPTGTTVTYSCLNMQMQARVNETVLDGRMDDYLKQHVYDPLEMRDTTYLPTAEQLGRTAPTAKRKDGSTNAGVVHDPLAAYHTADEHCPGNAGVFSTAPDLAKYCEMILAGGNYRGKEIFKPDTIAVMSAVGTPDGIDNLRGLGWDIYPPDSDFSTPQHSTDSARILTHTGYTGTLIWLDEISKAYVILLTNRVYPDEPKNSSKGISAARRKVVDTVLRAQPEYADHFSAGMRNNR